MIQPLQQQVIQPAATFLNNRAVQPTLAGTDRAAKFVNNQVLTPITTLGTAVNDNFVQPVKAAGSHFLYKTYVEPTQQFLDEKKPLLERTLKLAGDAHNSWKVGLPLLTKAGRSEMAEKILGSTWKGKHTWMVGLETCTDIGYKCKTRVDLVGKQYP